MRLIDEIIELLSSSDSNLTDALIKGQVLAHRLGEDGLAAWVSSELNGYDNEVEVPDYRTVRVTPMADLSNGYWLRKHQQLPLSHLSPEQLVVFQERKVRNSIAAIEEWIDKGGVAASFPTEMWGSFRSVINKDYEITRMWGEFGQGSLTQLLTQIRTRYLDFVLQLSSKLPDDPPDLQQTAKDIGVNEMFQGSVFGAGATINVALGQNSMAVQQNSGVVSVNDIASLRLELESHRVPAEDIRSLEEAIETDSDSEELQRATFGPGVKAWFSNMLLKAGTAAWDVTSQTAATVLATAIARYYGFA